MGCSKIQYVGKGETPFSIRLNNHRNYANGNIPKGIPGSIHFKQPGHNFNKHAKFTHCKLFFMWQPKTLFLHLRKHRSYLIKFITIPYHFKNFSHSVFFLHLVCYIEILVWAKFVMWNNLMVRKNFFLQTCMISLGVV